MDVLKRNRLRWYGHVRRRDNDHVLSKAAKMEVEGVRPRGRLKKTWKQCVEQDMRERNNGEENTHNRKEWKRLIQCLTP